MLKLMWLSDRMLGGSSAYSKVTFETCTRLARVGYQMAHIPMGRSNLLGKNVYHGVLLYPSGDEPFCEDVALQHYIDFKADMLITLKEPWIFNRVFAYPINYVPICPIDHSPVSNFITSRLQTAFKVVSISRFGQMELKKQGIDSEFIPHGVSEVYRPLEDKVACRKMFFLEEDDFVVGIVAMNRARKMIPQMLRGYKRFLEINRDVKSHLLLWTSVVPDVRPEDALSIGVQDVGVNLIPEIAELGLAIPPNDVRWFKPQEWAKLMSMGGLPEWDPSGGWDMVKLFNAMDCLLLCLPPHEKVWTNSRTTIAKKRIAHISEGDHVLTHKGRFQKVTKVMERDYSGQMTKISSIYGYNVTLTPNHPVLIRRKPEKHPVWIPASEVQKGDMVTIPKPHTHYRKKSLLIGRNNGKMRKELPWHINFEPLLFRFFGYYVTEGNTFLDKGTVQFSLHPQNDAVIRQDLKEMAEKWGLTAKETILSPNKMKVLIYNRRLAGVLQHHFGSNAHKKHLPAWALKLTDERHTLIPNLLKALWQGDGWISKTKAEYTTVSRKLAEQICFLLLKNGVLPCLSYQQNRKAYRVRIFGKQMARFGNLIGVESGGEEQRRSQFRSNASYYFLPVKKIETFDYIGKVYNLQVEGDKSYATPLAVHNCSGGEGAGLTLLEAAACGVTGITSDYAAGPEYVGPGLVVPWKDYVIYDTPGTRRVLADIDAMAEALTKIYNADREKFAKKAVRFAERYRWNNIIESYWKPFLCKCAEELYPLVSAEGTTSWV